MKVRTRDISASFDYITQSSITKYLDDIKKGEREPLNHYILPYEAYLELGLYMEAVENYIDQAEKKLRRWQALYEQSLKKNAGQQAAAATEAHP